MIAEPGMRYPPVIWLAGGVAKVVTVLCSGALPVEVRGCAPDARNA